MAGGGGEEEESAPAFEQERHLKHSIASDTTWASAYQGLVSLGAEPKVASLYAEAFTEQINANKSERWASIYASHIAKGETKDQARAAADGEDGSVFYVVGQAAALTGNRGPEFTEKYSRTYQAQREANKSHEWASAYASQIARGKPEMYAQAYAAKKAEGRSNAWAFAYASALKRGQGVPFAIKVADVFEVAVLSGRPMHEAKHYAVAVAAGEAELDINSKDANGDTSLIRAAREGKVALVNKLIEAKVDCNMRNNEEGKTALMVAAERGHVSIVALLLKADMMSVKIKDHSGKTALDLAGIAKSKPPKEPRDPKEPREQKCAYESVIEMLKGAGANKPGIGKVIQKHLPDAAMLLGIGIGLAGLAIAAL